MIAGRTPVVASRALRESLQRAVSCVTTAVLVPQTEGSETKLNLISRLVRPARDEAITLSIRHSFNLVHEASRESRSRWEAHTTGYMYTLEGADGREILAYHWHPTGNSHVTTPHLHLGAGAGSLRPELTKAHLDTGLITPVTLLALSIEQFGVRPRRADWRAVLEHTRAALAIL